MDEWQIARRTAASAGLRRMTNESIEGGTPQIGQMRNLFSAHKGGAQSASLHEGADQQACPQ